MLFNSIDFVLFLPLVYCIYWLLNNKSLKLQNIFLLLASYVFYGWWDWRFLLLILASTLVDYTIGLKIAEQEDERKRKHLLWGSLFVNLGLLAFFKYFNFFVDSFITAFTFMGADIDMRALNILLPVGISFYTFQTLSYTIDIYRRQLEPTKDFIAFAAFVSFFPQLVAGPIERAATLLPQILNKRVFNKEQQIEGIKLVIYGFFLKLVVADTLAPVVNDIFTNYKSLNGGTLILGLIFVSFQVYGDFCGYSKIARGLAKMFGMELMLNFNFPYFSRNIGEFWRRWHISLTTWFRDYLYIPIGGSHGGQNKAIRNIYIIFLVSGFWHGASWTFILWGFVHATIFIPSFLARNNRKYMAKEVGIMDRTFTGNVVNLGKILWTYSQITFITFIFFRAENFSHAIDYMAHLNFTFGQYMDMLLIVALGVIVDAILYLKLEKGAYFYPILLGFVIAAGLLTEKAEFVYFQF